MRNFWRDLGNLEINFVINMLPAMCIVALGWLAMGELKNPISILSLWYCGMVLMFAAIYYALIFFGDYKRRYPQESWWAFSKRMQQTQNKDTMRRNEYGYRDPEEYYLQLDCGHTLLQFETEGKCRPNVGEMFWCHGHTRFGPAQQHTIVGVTTYPGIEYCKVLT